MNAGIQARSDRFELLARGMLVVALIAGVLWALASNGSLAQGFGLGPLLG